MLPTPATNRSSQKDKPYFRSFAPTSPSLSPSIFTQLRARTRLTNLAVLLLSGAFCLSLLLNTSYYFSSPRLKARGGTTDQWSELASASQLDSGIPLSIERDGRYEALDHLVMVPGHSIWIGHDVDRIELDEEWILEPIQKGGSVKTYVKHIREGARILAEDPRALLVFSG
jgi:hypothetical protein